VNVTVMYEDRTSTVDRDSLERDVLFLSPAELEAATGWTLKPEGLCRGHECVPLPADGSWTDEQGRVDLAAFARRFDRPIVCDLDHAIWAFGESAETRREQLQALQAPDFALPDLDDREHALSDFRGKKVLLMSWGSYCGCRADLPVWEVLYQELKDDGFEILAVALDTGGKAAVEPSIRCDDLDSVPSSLRSVMGWSADAWERRAAPTYTCLIDREHVVADLYGINNVPLAVWIDEDGRIVRPAEPAGATDNHRQLDPSTFELPAHEAQRLESNRGRYWDAIRDWVDNGEASRFALSPDEVREAAKRPDADDVRAALHAKVGRHLFDLGHSDAAAEHFREAARLCPDHWNYRRQGMVLAPEMVGQLNAGKDFFDAVAALGTRPYYDHLALDGIEPDPLVAQPAPSATS
jgi:glutathione peroxidase-family protein